MLSCPFLGVRTFQYHRVVDVERIEVLGLAAEEIGAVADRGIDDGVFVGLSQKNIKAPRLSKRKWPSELDAASQLESQNLLPASNVPDTQADASLRCRERPNRGRAQPANTAPQSPSRGKWDDRRYYP